MARNPLASANLVRLAKDSFDLRLPASKNAMSFFIVLPQRNTTRRHFEWLELFLHLRTIHKIALAVSYTHLTLPTILRV